MIKHFNEVNGLYIEKIIGQDRLAYAMSDTEDFYDLVEFADRDGYQGSVVKFYDFENGNVYTPFEKKRDVICGKPVYTNGFYYFLRADYGLKKVTLYKYFPETVLEAVTEFDMDEVNLYNLMSIGEKVHVTSHDGSDFRCYYPEKISLTIDDHESVTFMTEGNIISEKWVEEGWDFVNDCATGEYKFYNKVIIRDFDGNIISEEIGSIHQAPDGTYWIS